MAIFEVGTDNFRKIPETTFSNVGLTERGDLQRLLRGQIEIISPDKPILVVAEEFGEWEQSKRRIDLLAVDADANLVVIELKRTEDGGHMDLQAVRYAAMVSTMTFAKVVDVFAAYLKERGRNEDPQATLLSFLEWDEPDEDEFAKEVRIILVSAEFSKELTTAVLWLNERDLDIRCVRIKPYNDNGRVLVDVQQVIPLPEALEYQVQIREKQQSERVARKSPKPSLPWSGYWYVNVGEGETRNWDDCRKYGFLSAGGGSQFSDSLKKLKPGQKVFAYMSGLGYVGYGEVTKEAVLVKDFAPDGTNGLLTLPLAQPGMKTHSADPEMSEWVVGIKWLTTFPREEARRFQGAFAVPNIVCKLQNQPTLDFLKPHFGVDNEQPAK